MFPFVRLPKTFGLGLGLLLVSLVALNFTTTPTSAHAVACAPNNINNNADIAYLDAMESHLSGKAAKVMESLTSQGYDIDLSVQLETSATATTSYIPGATLIKSEQIKAETAPNCAYSNSVTSRNYELTGTWTESTEVRPGIGSIKCCITVTGDSSIDNDNLYRRLSYALGLDLSRGDVLRIVYI